MVHAAQEKLTPPSHASELTAAVSCVDLLTCHTTKSFCLISVKHFQTSLVALPGMMDEDEEEPTAAPNAGTSSAAVATAGQASSSSAELNVVEKELLYSVLRSLALQSSVSSIKLAEVVQAFNQKCKRQCSPDSIDKVGLCLYVCISQVQAVLHALHQKTLAAVLCMCTMHSHACYVAQGCAGCPQLRCTNVRAQCEESV